MGRRRAAGRRADRQHPAQYTVDRPDAARRPATCTASPTRSPGRSRSTAATRRLVQFDPQTESTSGPATWRAPLVPDADQLPGGNMLAVSGLDEFGRIIARQQRDATAQPQKSGWTTPELHRFFPTYPALFRHPGRAALLLRLQRRLRLGRPGTTARASGTCEDNTFQKVPGLRDPQMNETSTSVLLPPAQDQKVHDRRRRRGRRVAGVHRRTDVADLTEPKPAYRPGPDLPGPGPLPERRDAARRHRASPPAARPATAAAVPGRPAATCRRADLPRRRRQARSTPPPNDGRPQLPLRGAAAAGRPGHDHGLRPALRQGRHDTRHVRDAHRDLHPALPVHGHRRPEITAARKTVQRGTTFTSSDPGRGPASSRHG